MSKSSTKPYFVYALVLLVLLPGVYTLQSASKWSLTMSETDIILDPQTVSPTPSIGLVVRPSTWATVWNWIASSVDHQTSVQDSVLDLTQNLSVQNSVLNLTQNFTVLKLGPARLTLTPTLTLTLTLTLHCPILRVSLKLNGRRW